jgi:dipeptidyl-peptidase-4
MLSLTQFKPKYLNCALALALSAFASSQMLATAHAAQGSGDVETLTVERIFASPALSGPGIRALKVSPAGDRVTFLRGKEDDQSQLDLWEYHIKDKALRLLVDSKALVPDAGELSDEEKARRERQRIAQFNGIVEYRWSKDGNFLLFPLAGDIYLYRLNPKAGQDQVQRVTNTEAFETDPQVAPDGQSVAYIREQNIYFTDLNSGTETQLTSDGKGTLRNGMAEFIAQEEMGRYSGYWWSPDSEHIAFLQVDQTPVPITKRYEIEANDIRIIEQRYPYAGADNVHIKLGIVDTDDGEIRWVNSGAQQDIYLPRVKWLPDSQQLSYQWQSRDQQDLELRIVNLGENGTQALTSRTLVKDESDTWVALHDDLYFFKDSPSFLWSSERDGYRHLYRYDLNSGKATQITAGEWQVDALKSVDEANGWVYFTATAESPTERHLYRQRLDSNKPEQIEKITQATGTHSVQMDPKGQVYIGTFSSRDQPPQTALYTANGERLTWLVENALNQDHPYQSYLAAHQDTEFGTLKAEDGQTLYYRITKPLGFDASKQYPVYYYVYGGPTAQTVTNRWDRRILFEQYMAQQGFIVFSLDNRGTPGRGMAFQAPAYHALGTVEVADQRTGVQHLRSLPYVDGDRIGMFGWSYGGYLTLMSVLKDPDSYATGVSVAPVTDWRLYDTHYTERYMGKPQDQQQAYDVGNVLNYAKDLEDPLMVIHGMADDNVLFSHTTQLYRQFQDNNILFETMAYPGAKHGISGQQAQTHVYRTIAEYFKRQLQP